MNMSVSQMLEDYVNGVTSDVLTALIWVVFGLIAFYVLQRWFKTRRDANASSRIYGGPAANDRERSKGDPLYIPAPVLRSAALPADGQSYAAVRDFAVEKRKNNEPLNEYEQWAVGPIAIAETLLGPVGLTHLDGFTEELPFKGWKLRQTMEEIGLPQIGETLESAVALHLHRYQLRLDMIATGMPPDQAATHPNLPGYEKLTATLAAQGGHAKFLHAADMYFTQAYPWADST